MDELMERQEGLPAVLDGYVQQGQMFLFNAAQNLLQFGRVLTEAKPLVPRGRFESFVRDNFRMSERTAQQYMAVWKRFGGKGQFETVQFSSLQKMLALPEGQEEKFAAENDLEAMTVRQVEAAVKQAREEERKSFEKEKAELENRVRTQTIAQSKEAILEARRELDDAKNSLAGIAEERAGWGAKRRELERQLEDARLETLLANEQAQTAIRDRDAAVSDLEEVSAALTENQQEYDRLQSELLDAKSSIAKGDAEREVNGELNLPDFCAAVRAFLGEVSQMPYMAGTFAEMVEAGTLRRWDESLTAVEDWTIRARKALNTVEGGIVHGK